MKEWVCITAETMLDGAPDAVKIACPVLAGGKAGDNIKGLPIGTVPIYPFRKGYFEAGKYHHCQYKRGRREIFRGFLGESREASVLCADRLHLL